MPKNPNHKRPSLLDRLRRAPAVPLIAILGATSLSACSDDVAAEKPPVTATATPSTETPAPATPETPVETEAPETTTSEPVETTPTQGDALNGIDFDASDLGPAGMERANKLTPDAVSEMIITGNFEPFEIHLSDIDPDVYGGTAAENYTDVAAVNLATILTSGFTEKDMETMTDPNLPFAALSSREFNTQGLIVPALTASFGEVGAVNSPASEYSFGQRAFDFNRHAQAAHESAVVDDVEYPEDLDTAMGQIEGNAAAETMPFYSIATSIKDKAVTSEGTGYNGNAMSISFTLDFQETTPLTQEQIDLMMEYIAFEPELYKSVHGSINVMVQGAVDDSDGDRITANTVYTELTSNQNADGTITE